MVTAGFTYGAEGEWESLNTHQKYTEAESLMNEEEKDLNGYNRFSTR